MVVVCTMLIDALCVLTIIVLTILIVKIGNREVKNLEDFALMAIKMLSCIVTAVFVIIYYSDRTNLPTLLGLADNIDISRWFDFTSLYVSTIAGAVISSIIIVLITMRQILQQEENNDVNKRIQNAPIFDYELVNFKLDGRKYQHKVEIKEKGIKCQTFFKIENIGLNHSKNVSVVITVDGVKDNAIMLSSYQSFIKKEEKVLIELIFEFDRNKCKNRKVSIDVHYEDFLNNEYVQRVNAVLTVTSIQNNYGQLQIDEFNVEKEKLEKDY